MHYSFLPKQLSGCMVLLMVCLLISCSTTRIVSKYDCDTIANNPVNQKTSWSFLWGLVQPKDINPGCDERNNSMNRVTVKDNYAYSFISVVTLGIVMPTQVEWCCAPYSPATDSLGD